MICLECGEYSYKEDVCVNCGLVVNDRPIVIIPKRVTDKNYNEGYTQEFAGPLSPHIKFTTYHSTNNKDKDFRRILRRTNQDPAKTSHHLYMVAFLDIGRICNFLKLNNNIKLESLNLYKCIVKKQANFFRRTHRKYIGYAACIVVACGIHGDNTNIGQICELIRTDYDFDFVLKRLKQAYREIIQMFKFPSSNVDNPNYISYVGNTLKLPQHFITKVHIIYENTKKFYQSQYLIKGYILGIFALYGAELGITIKKLEEEFGISTPTIMRRKKDLLDFQKLYKQYMGG